jgi:REP element-mobilizing transposase RayT
MARTARVALGGLVFHVLNRGFARMQLFEKPAVYQAFEQVMRETLDESSMRICAYTVMPNHWHLLLWPECHGELARFMQRLTITHVRRWQQHRGYAGLGHVYQGRYKSFPVELARAGQSRRRGARRTGITSSARATRPPVRPAGMAKGNCETIGPGIGLLADRSPAKNWPQSRCRAAVRSLG